MSATLYQLTNYFYGPQLALGVNQVNGYRTLGDNPISQTAPLRWTITRGGLNATQYNICTTYSNTNYCLDILNLDAGNRTTPIYNYPAQVLGQQWTLTPQTQGYYKLSNSWTGSGWYLDTYSGSGMAFMSKGNFQGQYWSLNAIQGESAFDSTSSSSSVASGDSSIPTATASISTVPSSTGSPAASTSSAVGSNSNSSSTNVAAIAGGVAGGVVGLGLIVATVVWLLWRRKKKATSVRAELQAEPSAGGDKTGIGGTQQTMQELPDKDRAEVDNHQIHELADESVLVEAPS